MSPLPPQAARNRLVTVARLTSAEVLAKEDALAGGGQVVVVMSWIPFDYFEPLPRAAAAAVGIAMASAREPVPGIGVFRYGKPGRNG